MSPGASRVTISIASWSPMKSEPLTVSNAWISGLSSAAFPRAALMPPSAAPEWLRVGCSFEIIATSAPASKAAMAARIPAQPAPTTRTSCSPITLSDATSSREGLALEARPGRSERRVVESLEVVLEHLRELPSLRVVPRWIAPRRARVEQKGRNTRNLHRHLEAEHLVEAEPSAVEVARERRRQHGARRCDRHALAFAERASRPAGVHEPHGRTVLVELLAEHLGVDRRALREERRCEAGRERRLRLGHADLRSGELRGEAGEEVVERLLA